MGVRPVTARIGDLHLSSSGKVIGVGKRVSSANSIQTTKMGIAPPSSA
jgi:hypothetical protein